MKIINYSIFYLKIGSFVSIYDINSFIIKLPSGILSKMSSDPLSINNLDISKLLLIIE